MKAVSLGTDQTQQVHELTAKDRATHLHVIGSSGRGKSRLLEHIIRQDIRHRHGVCVIDPHGALYNAVAKWCAYHRLQDRRKIHLIDLTNAEWLTGINPLACDISDPDDVSRTVDATVEVFAQVWQENSAATPLLKRCLRSIFYALAVNGRPLKDAPYLTTATDSTGLRRQLTTQLGDELFAAIWGDFNALRPSDFIDTFASTNNRLIEFLASPTLRHMFSLTSPVLDLQTCMDEGHIVLVNLQPKRISATNARLIGTLITNRLFSLAWNRDEKTAKLHPFYLFIDECYQFLTDDIEAMLDQSRKMGLHVTLAHQRLQQLLKYGEHIYNAVMTNAQTKIVFGGLSDKDAELLSKELLRKEFNYNRPKIILDKPVLTGHELTYVPGYSETEVESLTVMESTNSVSMSGRVNSLSGGESQTIMLPNGGVLPLATPTSQSLSNVSSSGESETSGVGHSSGIARTIAHASTRSESPMLMPQLEERPTAVEGTDEILHHAINTLRDQPERAFVLSKPTGRPAFLEAPFVAAAPTLPKRLAQFSEAVRTVSPYTILRLEAEAMTGAPADQTRDDDEPDDYDSNKPASGPLL